MSLKRISYWAGVMAALYVLFVIIFYVSNVVTIFVIRGPAPLTADVLRSLFVRDAIVCIPLTMVGTVVFAFMMRGVRASIEKHRR